MCKGETPFFISGMLWPAVFHAVRNGSIYVVRSVVNTELKSIKTFC